MLSEVERVLLAAVHDEEPPARLRREADAAGDRLTAEERALLLATDGDGLRLTGLLVAKLRFERVVGGDPDLRREFESDAGAFVERFRRYARDVPPSSVFPIEEARRFREWAARA